MRKSALPPLLALGLGLGVLAAAPAPAADPVGKSDGEKIARLIKQLGSDDFDDREKATADLDAVGAPALDALRLAQKSTDMEVQKRAEALVLRIEKRLESANALTPRRIHIVYKETPVAEAVDDFQKKTGYPIRLNDPENKLKDRRVTLDTGDVTFWQALDQFCDKAGLKEADAPDPAAPLNPPVVAPQPIIRPRLRINVQPIQVQPLPPAQDQPAPAQPGGARQTAGGVLQAAAPANPPAAVPPVAVQPGVIVGPIVGPVPAAPTVAAPNEIALEDGRADDLPADVSSAVRVRVMGKVDQFGPAPDGEIVLGLRLSLEPRMQWQSVDKVTITKAVDDQKQTLTQTAADTNPVGVPAPAPIAPGAAFAPGFVGRAVVMPVFPGMPAGLSGISQDEPVHLKKGEKPAKSLTELSGIVSAHILGDEAPVITATEILNAAGKVFKGGENGQIKVINASKNDNGQVTIRVEFQAPTDVVPVAGPNPVNGPVAVPIKRRPIQPAPAQPANPAAPNGAAPAAGVAAIGIAVAPNAWGPQTANGLTLLDDKGGAIRLTGTQIMFQSTVVNNVVMTTQQFLLTFQAEKGQEPAKLVYAGRKALSVEIPFALKDVPMP